MDWDENLHLFVIKVDVPCVNLGGIVDDDWIEYLDANVAPMLSWQCHQI